MSVIFGEAVLPESLNKYGEPVNTSGAGYGEGMLCMAYGEHVEDGSGIGEHNARCASQ